MEKQFMEQLSQIQNNAKREVLAATEKLRAEAVCVNAILLRCYCCSSPLTHLWRQEERYQLRVAQLEEEIAHSHEDVLKQRIQYVSVCHQ